MSLCLMNVHGDIEGDYEFVCDIPNGTNGEVMQALWEVQEITVLEVCVFVDCYPNVNMRFDKEWWNAPYQKGGE